MQPIVVTLQKGKETPGTYRFEGSDTASITTIYIKKAAFSGGSVPKAIRITVETIE